MECFESGIGCSGVSAGHNIVQRCLTGDDMMPLMPGGLLSGQVLIFCIENGGNVVEKNNPL